ncbi:MAG: sigma-70 family RNA polymerase sigma factor [Acidimicrobiia bacterium]|nr:sigma-70 family RNA polymerase sigma factor [Acidimicrobiia bacterium]
MSVEAEPPIEETSPADHLVSSPQDFDAVFVEEYAAMVRVAALMLGGDADAEEIVQDAFARLHERWSKVQQPGAYLRRCVLNGCTDRLRRRRVIDRFRSRPEVASLDVDHVLDALRVLPATQRAVVVLRFYEDRSELEIAPGTVKSRLHRALARLREVVER